MQGAHSNPLATMLVRQNVFAFWPCCQIRALVNRVLASDRCSLGNREMLLAFFFDSTWVLDVKICNNRTGPQISSYEQKKAAYIPFRRKPEQRQLVVYRATSNILTPTSSYWKSLLLFRDCTFSMEMTGGSNILKAVHHEFPFP